MEKKGKFKQTPKITEKFVLKKETIESIHTFTQSYLRDNVKEIHRVSNDINFLRRLPFINPYELAKECEEKVKDSLEQDYADGVRWLNAILKPDYIDIETLMTFELFSNALNGSIYPKPTKSVEYDYIINAMSVIILDDYEKILKSLKCK